MYNFFKDLYYETKDLGGILHIIQASRNVKQDYEETQLANLIRARTEMLYYLGIQLCILGINIAKKYYGVPDDENRRQPKFITYISSLIEYELRRLNTEIGALTPSPSMAIEPFKLLQNPAAAVTTMQDIVRTLGLLNPINYTE